MLWTVSERDPAVPERQSGPALDPGPRLKRAPAYQVPQRLGFHIVERWQFNFAQVVKSDPIGGNRLTWPRKPPLTSFPPLSVLTPLEGMEEGLARNLRSSFDQHYPQFELLFAVRRANDPALGVVRELMQEFPNVPAGIIITGEPPYPNAKVFSLRMMQAAARYDLLVMKDSDVRSGPGMLNVVAAEFQDAGLGVATCPYRAVAGPSFWSRLEAIGMNTDFTAGILVARMLEGMKFAVGPTIVARRRVLQAIGGFDRLKDYLAEDFVMGKFASDAGHGVILSSYVIEHHIGSADLRNTAAHRLRWTRSTRRSRPLGYVGQLFTMPLPLALLVCAVNQAWWPVLLLTLVVRLLAAYTVSARVLHAEINWLLLPIEDVNAFCFWLAGFFGNTIVWRGRRYRLYSDGRFELLPSPAGE